jgi:hypothetical protein
MLKFKEGFINNYQNYGAGPLLGDFMGLSFTQVPPGIHLPKLPTLRHAARCLPGWQTLPLVATVGLVPNLPGDEMPICECRRWNSDNRFFVPKIRVIEVIWF